ncbi:MAG: GyrI-like domain-containing protein [Chloroflexi bacterium]|nr:GyrI-like domain-containing protein [Chloroflexota bacterium]
MANLDLKQTYKALYAPSAKTVSVVDVPPLSYLMIDGRGDPNTVPRYAEAVQALYAMAYAIRFMRKDEGEVFTVMPLEGLWWFDGEPIHDFTLNLGDKDRFIWTMMILQPESVTPELVERAREKAIKAKGQGLLGDVRFERYEEGEAAQILYFGPYADEGPTIARLHECIEGNGWSLRGKHHEIYLNDPRKVPPEKMKTIIRQPFARG